jgi:hypothetical protein
MVKGKDIASASGAVVPKRKAGGWTKFGVTARNLNSLRKEGLLPATCSGKVRLPGDEVIPRPKPGERVMFVDFVNRGLSLPVHSFFRGLLFAYGLQLHNLTPNSILHIAVFITLCECYLGVNPHWGLWKRIFFLKRQGQGGENFKVGDVSIQVRSDVEYFNLRKSESVQGWRKKWFYIRDEAGASQVHGLPEFSPDAIIKKKKSWKHKLATSEVEEASKLFTQVATLQSTAGKEVTGIHLISTFIRRRVQPLQVRVHAMWMYEGCQDPTRTQ